MTSKNRVAENVHRQNNKDLHLQRNSLNRKHRRRFISKMFATFNGILKMKRARMYILCMHVKYWVLEYSFDVYNDVFITMRQNLYENSFYRENNLQGLLRLFKK